MGMDKVTLTWSLWDSLSGGSKTLPWSLWDSVSQVVVAKQSGFLVTKIRISFLDRKGKWNGSDAICPKELLKMFEKQRLVVGSGLDPRKLMMTPFLMFY